MSNTEKLGDVLASSERSARLKSNHPPYGFSFSLILQTEACGDVPVPIEVGVPVSAGDRPAAVDDRSVGFDGARGIDLDLGPVLQPQEPAESQPVEIDPADVATL